MRFNKGSVLITALLITAVVVAISTKIIINLRAQINVTQTIDENNRIYLLMQRFQYQAIDALGKHAEKEPFELKPFEPIAIEGATIRGQFQDQQGLFNINTVKFPEGQAVLKALIKNVQPKIKDEEVDKINGAISFYLNKVGMMVSVSELRGIKEVNQVLFLQIQPYLSALPLSKKEQEIALNIKGVDADEEHPLSLLVVLKNRTLDDVDKLKSCLLKKNREEFIQCANDQKVVIYPERVLDSSDYFLAKGVVVLEGRTQIIYTLFKRELGTPYRVRVLWQSMDTL